MKLTLKPQLKWLNIMNQNHKFVECDYDLLFEITNLSLDNLSRPSFALLHLLAKFTWRFVKFVFQS